jgi:hypothetical protein
LKSVDIEVILWVAEVILSSIGTGLLQSVYDYAYSIANPSNPHAAIIGIIVIIAAISVAFVLIIYYLKLFRIKYRETGIDVYTRNGGLRLDEFLKSAKKRNSYFRNHSRIDIG